MPNLDDVLGSAPAPPGGSGQGAPVSTPPTPTGGNLDSILGSPGPAAPATKKSGGGGFFGGLAKAAGAVGHVVGQAANFVNPVKISEGLYHLGQEGLGEAVAPAVAGARLAGVNPNTFGIKGNAGVDALLGNARGQKGLPVFAQEAPALSGAAAHLGNTAAGSLQLPVSAAEALAQRSTQPLQNSIFGQRIQKEGVLPSILSTAGDVAMIAGGAGAGLDAAGAGKLAEAGRLEGLANTTKFAPAEGYGSAAQADQMAQQATSAGQATQAGEHAAAAENLSKAADLRAEAAQQGPVMQKLSSVRQGLNTVEHMGNQVVGAPTELLAKGVPAAANLLTGGKAGELASAAADKVSSLPGVQGLKDRSAVRSLAKEGVSERQRLTQPVRVAFTEAAKLTPEVDDQLATQLVRRGDVSPLTAPQLAQLSDEQLQAHLDRTGIEATPAAVRTAIDYTQNPAAHPEMAQAIQALDRAQAPADLRYANGVGASRILGDGAKAERAATVAGEPSQAGIARRQGAIQKMIDIQQGRLDEAMQGGLSERPAALSEAQGRGQAARNARADVTERLGSERQGITTRAAADETNANAQRLANKRAVTDAEREIAARSQRISDLQARQEAVPGSTSVQAPQIRTAVQSAAETRQSLLQAAQEAHASGDVAEGQRLAAIAGKANLTAADLKAAGVEPTYLPGSDVPEKPVAGGGGKPRVLGAKKLSSERQRTGIGGPLDYESQQKLYENNIAGQVRNEVNRRLLSDPRISAPAAAHVEDAASLSSEDLAQALADKGRVPVGLVRKNGVDTVDQLDPTRNPAEVVTPDTKTVSAKAFKEYKQQFAPSQPGAVGKVVRTVENAGRITKLLGPGFVLHKGITDLILDKIAGGVGPVDLAKHVPEAYRQTKEGTLPGAIGTLEKPNLENASAVDRGLSKVAEKGMVGFRTLDSTNRGALYGALRDQGLSPMQAQERVQAVAGNIRDVNAQTGTLRHVITYPGWQLHLAKVLASIPTEHLSGLLQSGAVASAAQASYDKAHPNQKATTGGLDDAVNPFGSLLGLGKGIPGQSFGKNLGGRLESMIAPALEAGLGLGAGVNPRHGRAVTEPGQSFTSKGPGPLILGSPADSLGFVAGTFAPQLNQIRDAVGQAQGPGGYAPYRYDTGQPEKNSSGEIQAKPGTTKLGTLANLVGIPHATPVQPKKKK